MSETQASEAQPARPVKKRKLSMKERLERSAIARAKRERGSGLKKLFAPQVEQAPKPRKTRRVKVVPQRANSSAREKSAVRSFLEGLPGEEFDEEPGICNRLLLKFMQEVVGSSYEPIERVFDVMPNIATFTRAVLAEKARRNKR